MNWVAIIAMAALLLVLLYVAVLLLGSWLYWDNPDPPSTEAWQQAWETQNINDLDCMVQNESKDIYAEEETKA